MNYKIEYRNYAKPLIEFARSLGFKDRPARRMAINNEVDRMSKEEMKHLDDDVRDRYTERLSDLACELHNKNLKTNY